MRSYIFILLATLATLLNGCKGGDEDALPSNLSVQTFVSSDGSGMVTFKAKADNAVKYVFTFHDGQVSNTLVGEITHTYILSGSYDVIVSAISATGLATDKTATAIVNVKEPFVSGSGYTTSETYNGMTLVWRDEFDGNGLNTNFWNYEMGSFNNELQYYQAQNTVVQDGYLIIKALKQTVGGKNYTSSRLTTQGKKSFRYGRVDIRAKMPTTQGMFPALWMLGSSFATVGWPRCGEIDIMETIGGNSRDSVVYGTAHWANGNGSHVSYGGKRLLPDRKLLGDRFRVYTSVWSETEIIWLIDNELYHVIDITPAELSEFHEEFFFIINLAVGGEWAGSPDDTTVLPQRLVVDYIRVFQ